MYGIQKHSRRQHHGRQRTNRHRAPTISIARRISRSSIRHARFPPPRSRPKSRNESRLVAVCAVVFAVVRVVCISLRYAIPESSPLPSSSRRTRFAMRRVASQCIAHVYLRQEQKGRGGGGRGSSRCTLKHPRRVGGAALENRSFAICRRRGAVSKRRVEQSTTLSWE